MSDHFLIKDFLKPLDMSFILEDDELKDGQLGNTIQTYVSHFPDLDQAEVILLGITENRGTGNSVMDSDAADVIRKKLYRLYNWHTEVKVADIGNIESGAVLNDSYSAVKTVVAELMDAGKTVVLMGGSHDITLAQYGAYGVLNQIIEVCCVDALINLSVNTSIRSENFLMEILTGEPNFIRHYNHLAFQSYFVHPQMLQTMDNLRFDCFRVGVVKDQLEEMEPIIRNSNMVSIDISAIAHAFAPANNSSPNGLNGEEICTLTRYAGLSNQLTSLGIYGYETANDNDELTAVLIAQMIWYFIDGRSKSKTEAKITDRHAFTEYHTTIADADAVFLQSKKTGRWWMQLPNEKFIACSGNDYKLASHSEIPERWLRAQERD